MGLLEHIETHLGAIQDGEGWKFPTEPIPIQVIRFRDKPAQNISTFLTLGVSHHTLPLSGDEEVRQELLFCARGPDDPNSLAKFLAIIGDYVVARHEAIPLGLLINRSVPGTLMRTVLASKPTILGEDFSVFEGTSPPTKFVWLIPLHPEEADFKRRFGEEALLHLFGHANTDFFDLSRASVSTS